MLKLLLSVFVLIDIALTQRGGGDSSSHSDNSYSNSYNNYQ